jgi:predicted phosphodiesterase
MRIGLLTDIHEQVEHLGQALARLETEHLDVIVQLGDACDLYGPGRGTTAVVEMLNAAGVIGVWGNHDIGFCHEVSAEMQAGMEPRVLAYMANMRPKLELADCHFSHVDPYLDPTDVLSLWMAAEKPNSLEMAMPSFAATPQRILFLGHYHRWIVIDDCGVVNWDATSPLWLNPDQRFLIVVGPLVKGQFGVYDTDTCLLTPLECSEPDRGHAHEDDSGDHSAQ